MELLNVYAITDDGTIVEASANTVGAVPQGQIATQSKAGLFKVGKNRYKYLAPYYLDDEKKEFLNVIIITDQQSVKFENDRFFFASTTEVSVEEEATKRLTDLKVTYTPDENLTGFGYFVVTGVDSNTATEFSIEPDSVYGEISKTWVKVNTNGEAYVDVTDEDTKYDYATTETAGLMKLGKTYYKYYKGVYDDTTATTVNIYAWVDEGESNTGWYLDDRMVWTGEITIKSVETPDDYLGLITDLKYQVTTYTSTIAMGTFYCIELTYKLNGTETTSYIDISTGESNAKRWVKFDSDNNAYVEDQDIPQVDNATHYAAGTVMPDDSFEIEAGNGGVLGLALATENQRGGLKVEAKDKSGGVKLTLIKSKTEYNSTTYYNLFVLPGFEGYETGTNYVYMPNGDAVTQGDVGGYEPYQFSCVWYNGERHTVHKIWWEKDRGIADKYELVYEIEGVDDFQYVNGADRGISVEDVTVYRMYQFKNTEDMINVPTISIIPAYVEEEPTSDSEISDYVTSSEEYGNGQYRYYLREDGYYHASLASYLNGGNVDHFDATWLVRFATQSTVDESTNWGIDGQWGASGKYIYNSETDQQSFALYAWNMNTDSYFTDEGNFHAYATWATLAKSVGSGTATENRVILNEDEKPVVDVENLNITGKVQNIIDAYHTPKVATTTQLGHILASDVKGDISVKYMSNEGAVYTVKIDEDDIDVDFTMDSQHTVLDSNGYGWDSTPTVPNITNRGTMTGFPSPSYEYIDGRFYFRVNVGGKANTYNVGAEIEEGGTKAYVGTEGDGKAYVYIPEVEVKKIGAATTDTLGTVKFGTGYYRFEMHQDVDGDTYFNTTPLIAYCKIESSYFKKTTYPTLKKTVIGFGTKPTVDIGIFIVADDKYTVTAAEAFSFGLSDEELYGVKITFSDGTSTGTAYLSGVAGAGMDLNNFPVVNNGYNQMQVWLGIATDEVKGLVKSSNADPVDDTYYVNVDSTGVMSVKVAETPEATDTTLGTVQYGNNGYKYYGYADDTTTGVVISKQIIEITTNIAGVMNASTNEVTWTNTKPTYTWHVINDCGFTITGVTLNQSGTSVLKIYKFSIAWTDSAGNTGTSILKATGTETVTYGMVNKSSTTGQMMTDMSFLPDFIVAEMKKHTESWTFTLEDDSNITHNVVVLD